MDTAAPGAEKVSNIALQLMGGRRHIFSEILVQKLKFFSSPADNDSEYYFSAQYTCSNL